MFVFQFETEDGQPITTVKATNPLVAIKRFLDRPQFAEVLVERLPALIITDRGRRLYDLDMTLNHSAIGCEFFVGRESWGSY